MEQYLLGQLKVTAILLGAIPTAVLEDEGGRGFTVRKGTKVGMDGGEVVEILKDRVLILESKQEIITGKIQTRTIEMKLRLPDKALNS